MENGDVLDIPLERVKLLTVRVAEAKSNESQRLELYSLQVEVISHLPKLIFKDV